MLENLIGAQLVSIDDINIKVKLDGKLYNLEIYSDDGDCCGYAEFTTHLLYSEDDYRNPIITNIELVSNSNGDGMTSVLTFYGENKELAKVESEAGSGSGWGYGSYVNIRCKMLGIDDELASW